MRGSVTSVQFLLSFYKICVRVVESCCTNFLTLFRSNASTVDEASNEGKKRPGSLGRSFRAAGFKSDLDESLADLLQDN